MADKPLLLGQEFKDALGNAAIEFRSWSSGSEPHVFVTTQAGQQQRKSIGDVCRLILLCEDEKINDDDLYKLVWESADDSPHNLPRKGELSKQQTYRGAAKYLLELIHEKNNRFKKQ